MGALPKNKITRAERGKRRAGNTPSLKKVAKHSTIPLHKRGLVGQMMQALGLSKAASPQVKEDKKAETKNELVEKSVSGTKASRKTAATAANSQAGKKMRRGQHK